MEFNLKAVEIYEKEFTRSKKDKEFYSIQEVNDYLDLIIEDYQKIEKLQERLVLLEEENSNLKLQLEVLNGEKKQLEENAVEQVVEEKTNIVSPVVSVVTNDIGENNTELEEEIDNKEIIEENHSFNVIDNATFEEENTKINEFDNSDISVQKPDIYEKNQENTLENDKENQETVETLSIDDIAEIRRLLQEERESLYRRNEE